MARLLPFLGLCLLSFGVTHLALATRSAASPKPRPTLALAIGPEAASRAPAEGPGTACRPVRVVYRGPGPSGDCTPPR